jgi:hypothetical protein
MHARALEGFKDWDGWSPVARATGNDDRACTGAFAVGKIEDETAVVWIARRIKSDHLVWDQAMPVMPVGILDPSRGAGLTAKRAAVRGVSPSTSTRCLLPLTLITKAIGYLPNADAVGGWVPTGFSTDKTPAHC